MSPTEFDLRAALRDGEGDGPNVDRIVAGGRARRAQRRSQLLSTAAVVVFVAAAGTGGALLWGGNGSGGGNASDKAAFGAGDSRAAGQNPGAPNAQPTGTTANGGSVRGSADPAVACPTSVPHLLLPGGGSPGQFGADGPLFPDPVDSIVVCSYGSPLRGAGVSPARLVLTGQNATALASSLENASKTRSAQPCPAIRSSDQHSLAIIGVTAAGTALPAITTTLSQPACNVQVTNGTAVRYDWAPPANLQTVLTTLTPRPAGSGSLPPVAPSGKNIGSPVHT